jgi:hypothetical protein
LKVIARRYDAAVMTMPTPSAKPSSTVGEHGPFWGVPPATAPRLRLPALEEGSQTADAIVEDLA